MPENPANAVPQEVLTQAMADATKVYLQASTALVACCRQYQYIAALMAFQGNNYDVPTAARRLGVTPKWLHYILKRGPEKTLPALMRGPLSLQESIARSRVPAFVLHPEMFADPDPPRPAPVAQELQTCLCPDKSPEACAECAKIDATEGVQA